ncbi:DLW-39 family protein [Nesterenkonia pannonica]|nr:DLW-39 family protein [Nesterenkonia pannonica]
MAAAAAVYALAYREWRKNEKNRSIWADATDTVDKQN